MGASALTLIGVIGYVGMRRVQGQTATSDRQTSAVVDATTAFLRTLSADQRQKVQFVFTLQKTGTIARFHRTQGVEVAPGPPGGFVGEQYGEAVWSNYPVSDVPRLGLRLGSLSASQRGPAMHLMQTVLSPMGYQKVLDIMGSDQALADAGTNFCLRRGGIHDRHLWEPRVNKRWMIEFGGHHLGLNIVIDGSNGAMTPTLTGAQPSVYKRGDMTVRVLARENDTAFALLDPLSASSAKRPS